MNDTPERDPTNPPPTGDSDQPGRSGQDSRDPFEPTTGRVEGERGEAGAEALVRRALAGAAEEPGPPPRLAPEAAYAQGRRVRRRITTLSVVGVAAAVALVVAVAVGATTLRPSAAPVGPGSSPSGPVTPAPSPDVRTTVPPGPPTGGTVTTSPGQQPPVFSVAEASGPYCGTNPVIGQTVRDQLPIDGRWGPDLPMFGICDTTTQGLELPVIQGNRVGVVTIVVDLVNPRAAQSDACQGMSSCQQVAEGWLGTGMILGGNGATLITTDGTRFAVSASAGFENSDLFDGGAGKLPGLSQPPYDTDQLSNLAITLAGKVHIG
jgi:hypothetical protein